MSTHQPNISSQPDSDCANAYGLWDANLRSIQSATELSAKLGFFTMSLKDYYDTQEMKGFSGGMSKRLLGSLDKGSKDMYAQSARYFVRSSEYSGTPKLKVFQLTYANSLRYTRSYNSGDSRVTETHSYPPFPITNFVVCPIPGRVIGEYAITSRFGEFFINQSKGFSQSFLQELNSFDFAPGAQTEVHSLAQAARFLFSLEKDYFQDDRAWGWKQRQGSHEGFMGGRPQMSVSSRYDEYFMSTLLDTELLDVERWPNYPKTKHGKRMGMYDPYTASEAEKHFFVMLTPYRNRTLFMVSYPVSSSFGRNGELLSTNLATDWVLWMIRGVAFLLTRKGNFEEPTSQVMSEKHMYWSLVGRTDELRRPAWSNTGKAVNLPVIPFQEALSFTEGEGKYEAPQPVAQAISVGTKSCSSCGARMPNEAVFCTKCGHKFPDAAASQQP